MDFLIVLVTDFSIRSVMDFLIALLSATLRASPRSRRF
jgi:hypothetical protein